MTLTIKMVDISKKPVIYREATASGLINLKRETIRRIKNKQVEKGDPIQIATVAGINASKIAPQLMPLCHPLKIESIDV